MNKLINTALYLGGLSLVASSSWAQDCASIQFDITSMAGKSVLIEPVSIDGEYKNVDKHYRALVNGEYQLYLEPGVHSLGVKFWEKNKFMGRINKLRTTRVIESYSAKKENVKTVEQLSLMLANNFKYVLGVEKGEQQYNVVVKSKEPISCSAQAQEVYAAPKPYSAKQQDAFVSSKLGNIVKAAYQYTDRSAYANTVHFAEVFGSSTQYDTQSKSLLVSNVIASSFADQLGMKVGDQIIAFGDTKKKKVNKDKFNAYLASLKFGNQVDLVVERNGEQLTLSQMYLPVAVPEYTFNFVNTTDESEGYAKNAGKLDEKVNAYFDAQMLELSKHLLDNGYQGNVHFNVPLKGDGSNFHFILSLESRRQMEEIVAKTAGDFDKLSDDSASHFDMTRYREMMNAKQNSFVNQVRGRNSGRSQN